MKQTWILFWKGVLIGTAFIVPGVSGGTMALITGLYFPFILALSSFRPALLFNRKEFLKFWNLFSYLIPALIGAIAGFLFFVQWLALSLKMHPVPMYCFFSGLVFSSMPFLIKEMNKEKSGWTVFICSSAVTFIVSFFTAGAGGFSYGYVFLLLSVFLAVSAMLLPGVSGSYILILMGTYSMILNDLSVFSWRIVLYFLVGILSLTLVSRWIRLALEKHQQMIMSGLAGMAFGGGAGIFPIKSAKTLVENGLAGFTALVFAFVLVFFTRKIKSKS